MRTLRNLAFTTAAFAYAVIVIGFVVRITGSGMGCGPDWPLCNGAVIPAFTSAEVAIEWTHRVAVLGLAGLTLATAGVALWGSGKGEAGSVPSGRSGVRAPALLLLALFIVQSLLGRQAVKLELEALTVVVHLGLALVLLAVLVVLGLRAGAHAGLTPPHMAGEVGPGGVAAAVALGALALLLGGLTANLGATGACTGFPLCNGQIWPDTGLARVHWVHRLVAYGLFFHMVGLAARVGRRAADIRVKRGVWLVTGLVTAQVALAVFMVLGGFPALWRALHAVVGTAVWVGLVYLAWTSGGARRRVRSTAPAAAEGAGA